MSTLSPDVLSTLLLLQQGNVYKLQQKILHGISRSSCPEVFCKKVALKTTQSSQENTSVGVFLIKLQAFGLATLLRRDSNTGVFL